MNKLSTAQVCIGNCDDKFEEIAEQKKKNVLNITGETVATIDTNEILFKGEMISRTIRHVDCDIIVDSEDGQCKTCKTYRPILRAMYHRYKQAQTTESTSIKGNNKKLQD